MRMVSETVTLRGEARLDLGASLFFRGLGLFPGGGQTRFEGFQP
jgi:hypothetical protein